MFNTWSSCPPLVRMSARKFSVLTFPCQGMSLQFQFRTCLTLQESSPGFGPNDHSSLKANWVAVKGLCFTVSNELPHILHLVSPWCRSSLDMCSLNCSCTVRSARPGVFSVLGWSERETVGSLTNIFTSAWPGSRVEHNLLFVLILPMFTTHFGQFMTKHVLRWVTNLFYYIKS